MFFDTHAHYDDMRFDSDRDELLGRVLPENGVDLVVNIGSSMQTSRKSVELASRYDYIYAAVGVHPGESEEYDIAELETLASFPKVVAIGEIGLDYHYSEPDREIQTAAFVAQMELAAKLKLPVVIHDRDAHEDCLRVVKDFCRRYSDLRGVFHCYSGSAEMANEIVKLGWSVSFTGVITFKNARKARETAAAVPIDRIMIETDCPYLSPEPNRGKRNDSSNLRYIAEVIAELKGTSAEDAARITAANGRRFFGI
ncbi:MAG: TatD family hydrolase [Oscillospiraceae bacterium]|nr:TatD family hydrolase [Oscillospiraceae bacterium]